MVDNANPTTNVSAGTDTTAVDNTSKAIQKATDVAEGQGFYGDRPENDPLDQYTLKGVTSKSSKK